MDSFRTTYQPNLIAGKIKQSVSDVVSKKVTSASISDRVYEITVNLYDTFIKDWILIVIVLVAIVYMLVSRYYDTDEKGEPIKDISKEPFSGEEKEIMDRIMRGQTKHLMYDEQPHFDRLHGVNQQQQYVNYPGQTLPVNLPGVEQTYSHNYFNNDYPAQYENLNNPNYDYSNVYSYPERTYYNGTLNTYQDAQDTNINNPLGFSNNFNTTTGSFISGMTGANKNNLLDYQQILDGMNKDLTYNVGPDHLNVGYEEPTMIPPYSTGM